MHNYIEAAFLNLDRSAEVIEIGKNVNGLTSIYWLAELGENEADQQKLSRNHFWNSKRFINCFLESKLILLLNK